MYNMVRPDYWYKADVILQKLEKCGIATYEKGKVILNWDDANPEQDYLLRRYTEYRYYYEQEAAFIAKNGYSYYQ